MGTRCLALGSFVPSASFAKLDRAYKSHGLRSYDLVYLLPRAGYVLAEAVRAVVLLMFCRPDICGVSRVPD